jgi:hypothetical protein
MADEIDATNARVECETALLVNDVSRKAQAIPQGQQGECYYCGEEFSRVVFVASVNEFCCGRCRDKRGLE